MSKSSILNAIKNANTKKVELKTFGTIFTTYDDKESIFKKNLKKAGGEAFEIEKKEINQKINELFGSSKKIVSFIKDYKINTIDKNSLYSPKDLKKANIAVVEASFGVCENGALWCDEKSVKFRSIYVICENLIILLNKKNLLNNMHEAYKKIDLKENNFGIFISGPSKTADIEQALVIGAHGAIKTYIFLY